MQGMFVGVLVLAIYGCGSPAQKPHNRYLRHSAKTPHGHYLRELMPRAVYDSGPRSLLASPGQLSTNADMVVVCTRGGRAIKQWAGQARWKGKLPDRFEAAVRQGRISNEIEIDPAQVRLEVHSDGSGGVTLEKWVDPGADRVIVIVKPAGKGMDEGMLGEEGTFADEGNEAAEDGQHRGERGSAEREVAIPARLRPLFKQDTSRQDSATLRRIIGKLAPLTDEELEVFLAYDSAQTGDLDALETALDEFLAEGSEVGQANGAQAGQGSGASAVEELSDQQARDILRSSPAERRQKIGEWVERQARRQAGQALEYLWNHPSQAAVEMAKGLSPIRQAEGVLHDLSAAADGQSEGWSRLASAFGTTKRVSGFGATLAGTLAIFTQIGILSIPGVNVAYLTSVTIAAGLVALTAASLEAQAAREAAVKAKTPVELREKMRRSADAQAEVFLGTLMVAVPAAVSSVFTRIGLPGRLQALGRTLHHAEQELARGVKPPVEQIRTRVRDSLVKTREGLQSALGREIKTQQTALQRIKALTPDELVDKLAQGDEMLKKATGLSAEHAKAIRRLGASERGRGFANELHKNAIRTLTHALGEVQAQGRALMSSLDQAIARLKGAGSRQALQAAVAWARRELDRERIAFQSDSRILASGRRLMAADGNTPLAMSAVSGGGPGGKMLTGTGGGRGTGAAVLNKKAEPGALHGIEKPKTLAKQERTDGVGEPEPSRTFDSGRTSLPGGLPAELAALRNQLTSPEAIAQFDARYQSITKGKHAPTQVELDRFRRYLNSKGSMPEKVEAELAAEWVEQHPRPKPPTGNAVDQLPGLRELANRVLRRLEDAKRARPELTQGLNRLHRKVMDESKDLARMEHGHLPVNDGGPVNVQGMRNNIESVEAELEAALKDPHAVDLSRKFKLNGDKIEIDRITNGGDRWVDVKNYELFGEHSSNMRTLMEQAKKALQLAEANPNPATGRIPEVVYEFSKGITPEARRGLETVRVNARGIIVVGESKPLRGSREAP